MQHRTWQESNATTASVCRHLIPNYGRSEVRRRHGTPKERSGDMEEERESLSLQSPSKASWACLLHHTALRCRNTRLRGSGDRRSLRHVFRRCGGAEAGFLASIRRRTHNWRSRWPLDSRKARGLWPGANEPRLPDDHVFQGADWCTGVRSVPSRRNRARNATKHTSPLLHPCPLRR